MWRVIWLVPAFTGIIVILLIFFFFPYETISCCLMEGKDEQGMLHLKRIYRKKNKDDPEPIESMIDNHYNLLRKSTTLDAASTSFREAVFGRKYRKASWVCFTINSFTQWTGVNVLTVYANRLIVQIKEQGDGTFPITPV